MKETDSGEQTKWQKYAKGKKPTMKRRCAFNDYLDRGIYMITIATEGRRPLLGRLMGQTEKEARVELSAFGERVKACWMAIPHYYPQIEVIKLCIMPDHIHGIIFVHERMNRHLGHVINGFKTGCRKAARELWLAVDAPQTGKTAAVPQYTGQEKEGTDRHHGVIWEENYNDRILHGKDQYQRMLAYIDDNPRRLLIKRLHPEYFHQLGTINVIGISMQAMGNRFLLDNPVKLQIQCSRKMSTEEIDHYQQDCLRKAREEGAILVSPCISPGEQQIASTALQAKIPLIVLLLKGLSPYFKPQPRYLEACSEGRLLILSPYPFQNEKLDDMRHRCLHLNTLAATICENDRKTSFPAFL